MDDHHGGSVARSFWPVDTVFIILCDCSWPTSYIPAAHEKVSVGVSEPAVVSTALTTPL